MKVRAAVARGQGRMRLEPSAGGGAIRESRSNHDWVGGLLQRCQGRRLTVGGYGWEAGQGIGVQVVGVPAELRWDFSKRGTAILGAGALRVPRGWLRLSFLARLVLIGRVLVSTVMTNTLILMAKTLQVRIEEGLRTEADEVLHEIGLDVPSAVRLFLTKVVQTRSIPFELKAPGIRVVEVAADPDTQVRMDEIGAVWAKKKPRRE